MMFGAWSQTRLFLWNDANLNVLTVHIAIKGGKTFVAKNPDPLTKGTIWRLDSTEEIAGKAAVQLDMGLLFDLSANFVQGKTFVLTTSRKVYEVKLPKGKTWADLDLQAVVLAANFFPRTSASYSGTISVAKSEADKPMLALSVEKPSANVSFSVAGLEPGAMLPMFKPKGKPVIFPKDEFGDAAPTNLYQGSIYYPTIIPEEWVIDGKYEFGLEEAPVLRLYPVD